MTREHLPPKIGRWLLRKIYDANRLDDVAGDLQEIFHDRLADQGRFIASIHYLKDVILSLRNIDLNMKSRRSQQTTGAMLLFAIVVSFRSLKKRASYSLLNIAGLATSMAFGFLLWQYIYAQSSFDRHLAMADRIYRVNVDCDMNGKRDIYCNVPQPVAKALKADYPEVNETLRVALGDHKGTLEYEGKRVASEQLFIAEPTVFQFFGRELTGGNTLEALTQPNSVVLSESMAIALFGSTHVLGKIIRFAEESKDLRVTGIMKDERHRTHLPMEAILSWATFKDRDVDWWYGAHTYTYVLLNPQNDIAHLETMMPAFFSRHMKKTFDEFNGKGRVFFQPVTDIHLSNEYVWEPYPHGSAINVMALRCVALFLIAFAAINYVNLATARASERAGEVGIRKVLGSSRLSLWAQFMSESILLSIGSGFLALILSWLLLPYFNQVTDLPLTASSLFTGQHLFVAFVMASGIGILAGLFPAFYLSSLQALKVLKGRFTGSARGEVLRKVLVTSQYFIATLLISGILLVYQQVDFIRNKDIGFDKANLVSIHLPGDSSVDKHIAVFTETIKSSTHVTSVSRTHQDLHQETNSFSPTLENEDGTTFQMGADLIYVDADFLETIGATLVTGRNFSKDLATDPDNAVLINEAAVRKFGWSKNPLGGKFAAYTPREPAKRNVVGVVKDFHLGLSYQLVHPTIIFFGEGSGSNLYVRIREGKTEETLSMVRKNWEKLFPNHALEYHFVDQALDSLYAKEQKFSRLLTGFCLIILFIASLGIIGLISYTAQMKKKEIAIRKVIGASLGDSVSLLSKKFAGLLLIANALAAPASYYLMTTWLRNFAYRVEPGAGPFVIAFFVGLFFTALSLSYHTLHAASANPVDALKYE